MLPVSCEQINLSDIHFILQHPWEVSAWEFELKEGERFEDTTEYIQTKLSLAEADGFVQCWKTEDGLPIAILAFYNAGVKKYETLFIASVQMELHGLKITRACRDLLKQKATTSFKGCSCRLYSSSNHPKQIKWFEFIGFSYLPSQNIGNCRCFGYVSVAD